MVLGLNALAVVLTGASAVLVDFQAHQSWSGALIAGGIVACTAGLLQLAKLGIVVTGNQAAAAKPAA